MFERVSLRRARIFASRLLLLAVGPLSAAASGCATTKASVAKLDVLIERNTEARGGRAAIEAIRSLQIRLRIVEPTYTAEGAWQADRKGRMRIDVFIGGRRVFTEGFDGARGWQRGADDEHGTPASNAGQAALSRSAKLPTNLLGLHEMASHGHRLELEGREEIAGTNYHVLLLTLDDGFTTRYYVDPASFLIAHGRVVKALHPDIDPTPTTIDTSWSDFRTIEGLHIPFEARETDLATGKLLQTTTLLEIHANVPADDHFFQMP